MPYLENCAISANTSSIDINEHSPGSCATAASPWSRTELTDQHTTHDTRHTTHNSRAAGEPEETLRAIPASLVEFSVYNSLSLVAIDLTAPSAAEVLLSAAHSHRAAG